MLKFVDVDEKDALRFYLNAKFDGLPKSVRRHVASPLAAEELSTAVALLSVEPGQFSAGPC